ncbi:MAG: isocitrate/isopropylmalate family dehydrogenase [Candidatus Dormibacteria bacterium]
MTRPQTVRRLLVLGGDGVGPEVTRAAVEVLAAVARILPWPVEIRTGDLGRSAFRRCGDVAPPDLLARATEVDAVLVGAVDTVGAVADGAPQGSAILSLRRALGCYAALRPARVWPGTEGISPLRESLRLGTDLLFVRELSGGVYSGPHHRSTAQLFPRRATDRMAQSEPEIIRVARAAFSLARARRHQVTSVEWGTVLASSKLWSTVVSQIAARNRDVSYQRMRAGEFARELLRRPTEFDVVVTENLLGDILSDEAGALVGSLAMLPSAALSRHRLPHLYEPVHGAAPEIAGHGVANPIGSILSLAMLLREWGSDAAADAIESAVGKSLQAGMRTPDIGGSASTREMTTAIIGRL